MSGAPTVLDADSVATRSRTRASSETAHGSTNGAAGGDRRRV